MLFTLDLLALLITKMLYIYEDLLSLINAISRKNNQWKIIKKQIKSIKLSLFNDTSTNLMISLHFIMTYQRFIIMTYQRFIMVQICARINVIAWSEIICFMVIHHNNISFFLLKHVCLIFIHHIYMI